MKKFNLILMVLFIGTSTSLSAISSRQLERITDELIRENRLSYQVQIFINDDEAKGIASIRYNESNYVTIYVDAYKLQTESSNTWAFIIGHELAHRYLFRGNDPESEWAADVQGARWAVNSGYSAKDYVDKLLSEPDYCGRKHGCWHGRAKNIARKMRVRFDTSKDYRHRGHKSSRGVFPTDDQHNECKKTIIRCRPANTIRRVIPCQHRVACRHFIYRGRFQVGRKHAYDVLHARGDIVN